MSYATLMVHLDASRSNIAVLSFAARLAKRTKTRVIGIAACAPVQIGTCDGNYSGDFAVVERDIVDDALKMVEAEFKTFAPLEPFAIEWRSMPTM